LAWPFTFRFESSQTSIAGSRLISASIGPNLPSALRRRARFWPYIASVLRTLAMLVAK
jgi:hypothetical protein